MELELLNFIKSNNNWEELLKQEPYNLTIKRDNGYILFKYDQLTADFSLQITREARGIILRESDFQVVCFPFTKFFNVDEPYAAKIDWNNVRVQEKVDGWLIKLWFAKDNDGYSRWHVSTNGTIDAFKCDTGNDTCPYDSAGELFMSVFPQGLFNKLNKDYTYMFELVSPYTKIVVPYPYTNIYHIGTRNNITGEELNEDIGIIKPKEYDLKTEQAVRDAANALPYSEEGYVVVDNKWNRVKIKSPAYVNAHRLVNNKVINTKKVLELILNNEQGEFLSYFPEYREAFKRVQTKYMQYKRRLAQVEKSIKKLIDKSKDKKDFAKRILNNWADYKVMAFMLYDKKISDFNEYLQGLTIEKLITEMDKYQNRIDEGKLDYKRRMGGE